jgi:proteic killer suppression protein
MIRSFRSKALSRFAASGDASKLSVQNAARVRRILLALNDAPRPEAMNLEGYRFHRLKGRDKDRYSVSVSGNWRITFAFAGKDAVDVDLEDYH